MGEKTCRGNMGPSSNTELSQLMSENPKRRYYAKLHSHNDGLPRITCSKFM